MLKYIPKFKTTLISTSLIVLLSSCSTLSDYTPINNVQILKHHADKEKQTANKVYGFLDLPEDFYPKYFKDPYYLDLDFYITDNKGCYFEYIDRAGKKVKLTKTTANVHAYLDFNGVLLRVYCSGKFSNMDYKIQGDINGEDKVVYGNYSYYGELKYKSY